MNKGITVIILGASGDLAKKKLFPALYSLLAQERVKDLLVVGGAIEETTSAAILAESKQHVVGAVHEPAWDMLVKNTYYQHLDFSCATDFKALAQLATLEEKKRGYPGNRLVYCACAPTFFCQLTEQSVAAGLITKLSEKDALWQRIVYEKPFGHDLASAHVMNKCIQSLVHEHQVYRIDHFLTKDLVSNLGLIRFSNCIFEPLWNNRYIDNVQIILSEKDSVERRGLYYDKYGALRDVVQNHMLELLALIAMEAPEKLEGDFIRVRRARVLEQVRFVDGFLGQYQGYKQEGSVAPDSTTETFAELYLTVDNPRWAGVPFYLKTGKCLDERETVIHIKFKQVDCLLAKNCPSESNYLTIRITPEESFILTLNARKPGGKMEWIPMSLEYCHSCGYKEIMPTAHAALLDAVMHGEQSVSVRFDEIESCWKLIDAIRAQQLPLYSYAKGSAGPQEAQQFAHKHGFRWRS
ncbi:glucose-6-phosphate dehydrogenase [Candidatus Dependentiae bacterium HGW-Dependentiae-1]|nr:MAG: glucose-6-phosphate dehydrogenase [Candidatus Dependentiae bacterium HGW-Dependentiae-1]